MDIFCFKKRKIKIKKTLPIKPLNSAITLEDASIYRTKTPMVPNMTIDDKSCIFDFISCSFKFGGPCFWPRHILSERGLFFEIVDCKT